MPLSNATVTCGNCRHEFDSMALFCPHCGRPKVRTEGDDPLLGKILGDRFLVQDKLGQGASGMIYRAEHVTLRRKVAIKVLHHELSRDDLALERFRREATVVADIDNEHIVEIHDFGRTPDGRLYLAMELLDGETLDVILEREPTLPFERVIDVMTQVGEALIEAHAIGYIHRDIRPRNILLALRRGRANFVKLLDFGLSKLVESEGQAASTSLGMTFGDPRYMSPEAARGDSIDRRSDVYQLGCVAYEMMTGAPPFVGGRVFDVLSRHVSETPVPVGRKRTDTPRWLEVAVMRMLAKRPEERFATMTRMVEALRLGTASGQVMEEETARQVEAEQPASVSRVMEKLGRTALGPHSGVPTADEVAAAAGVTRAGVPGGPAPAMDDSPTQAMAKMGPRGTPRVGVPIVEAPARPAAAPAAVATIATDATMPVTALPSVPATAGPPIGAGKAGVWARPGVDPSVARPPTLPQLAAAQAGSTGKLPAATRAKRPSESAGISSVWYQDGEKLDGGADLDESAAEKLDRARRLMQLPGDSTSDGYVPTRRPMGKIAAIGAGAVLLLIVLLVVALGGGGDSKPSDARAGTATPDAGARSQPAYAVDGGAAALATDGGVPRPIDAGIASAAPDAGTKVVKKGPKEPREPKETRDPLDIDGTGSGSSTTIPDDEAKAKAEFFAKAGEGQLRGGDAQGAASNFKKALELDPKNVGAVIGLGEVAMSQGLYDAAIKHLKKAAKLAGRSSLVHTLLGECYLNSGKSKQAEASFKKALQLDPDNRRAVDGYNEASSRLPPPVDD